MISLNLFKKMYKFYRHCELCNNKIRISCSKRFCSKLLENSPQTDLDPGYVPHKVESFELEDGYFRSVKSSSKTFSMILPPPNITGTLHLGHALTATVQDIIARWKRMQGIETIWIPGIDHAGIATQVVVEKRLWKERRQSRHDIGRKAFEDEVWRWKNDKANVIGTQLRRLGVSLDWEREVFTMDKIRSEAVTEAFVRLFEAGLIYRADHLVNWSCVLQSAISDIEVDHLNLDGPTDVRVPGYDKPVRFGVLTHFAYKFLDDEGRKQDNEEIVVATTRPETMLGDVAVAVNPQDDRYARYVGRYLWHPFRRQPIPVIRDDFVDPDFATGAVKVTPAHDHADFDVGKRHNLDVIQVIDERGNLTVACKEFAGRTRFEAREDVVAHLERLQLLRGREPHPMIVPICSRSKDVVEFLVRPQWFVKSSNMAGTALDDVRRGTLSIEPKHFEKTWFNWLENIRDWCISRQLWWGHRVPAYSCYNKQNPFEKIWVAAKTVDEAKVKASQKLFTNIETIEADQDEDVLDTWFSSALLPFSAFGWPKETSDSSKFYPLSLMETGHDILFFWVARMTMLGRQLTGQLPFDKILLHGIICDAQGRKMSKSLGNVVAPEDVISGSSLQELEEGSKASYDTGILSEEELKRAIYDQKKMFPQGIPECGADALRFTLASHNIKNHFINLDVNECHTNKLFCNKIWQATKFMKLWIANTSKHQNLENVCNGNMHSMDKWILSRLSTMVDTVNSSLEKYDFHLASAALKNFLYYDFCDVYLETTKRGLKTSNADAAGHCRTLFLVLETALRALAPFMPFLAHHLHQHLPHRPEEGLTKRDDFPKSLGFKNEQLEKDVEEVLHAVTAIRRLKKIFNIVAKHKCEVHIVSNLVLYSEYANVIQDLSACHKVNVSPALDQLTKEYQPQQLTGNMVKDNLGSNGILYLTVPDELKKAIELDMPQMERKKLKIVKELEKMNKMISGETYRVNATEAAQEIHAKKIATLEEKLARINYIQSLSTCN